MYIIDKCIKKRSNISELVRDINSIIIKRFVLYKLPRLGYTWKASFFLVFLTRITILFQYYLQLKKR